MRAMPCDNRATRTAALHCTCTAIAPKILRQIEIQIRPKKNKPGGNTVAIYAVDRAVAARIGAG